MSVADEWRASLASQIAQRALPRNLFDSLAALARQDAPAIADALEQFAVLPDEAELINTLEIIAKMNPSVISKESAAQAEQQAMWAPNFDSDSKWKKSRKRKTADYQKELDELNIQHLTSEQQMQRYAEWLQKNPATGSRRSPLVADHPAARMQRIMSIISLPSTSVAKSTGPAAPHPTLFNAAQLLVGDPATTERPVAPRQMSSQPAAKSAQKAVTTAVAPSYEAPRAGLPKNVQNTFSWGQYGTLHVFTSPKMPPSSKIAAFDMDHTLIAPKSGAKFPVNAADWKWHMPQVKSRLLQLHNDGYNIVIFSNQGGIAKGNQNPDHLKQKIWAMVHELGIPIQALLAAADDQYRKPATTMWDYFVTKMNSGVHPGAASFYCGDAAGRPASGNRKKDFSCGDRAFAFNIGLPFKTETEFFQDAKPEKFEWDSVDPAAYLAKIQSTNKQWHADSQELVVFIGAPGSGKSTFARKNLIPRGYVHVNRDTLKTPSACIALAVSSLESGKSVVVDNTSPKADARAPFIQAARDRGIPVRCFRFKTDVDLAKHLNMVREKTQGIQHVPDIAYNLFQKHLEEPVMKEGYSEIVSVPFIVEFDSDEQRRIFLQRT